MSVSKSISVVLFYICISLVQCNSESGEYYWRPWTAGSPPSDAFTGRDYRGVSYIVEAYTSNFGEFVGQAFANQQDVNVTAINKTQIVLQKGHSLKVLCTQSLEKLAWYPTNQNTFENELITGTINPVIGGYNEAGEVLYVGKYVNATSRAVLFGSIGGSYRIHYNYGNTAYRQINYEVLIVNNKNCK